MWFRSESAKITHIGMSTVYYELLLNVHKHENNMFSVIYIFSIVISGKV